MRRDRQYLTDILEACDDIASFIRDRCADDLLRDKLLAGAVLHRLILIGEAAVRLSDAFKARSGDIPWTDISGLRNRLVHAYFAIDPELVWEAAHSEVPELRRQIESLMAEAFPADEEAST